MTASDTTAVSNVAKFKTLICQKDSTTRFVALFLLLQILKNDEGSATECWKHIEPAFLDRLILAGRGMTSEEAQDLQGLGVAVIHAYAFFPNIARSSSYIGRSEPLLEMYVKNKSASRDTQAQVEVILETIASSADGAAKIITCSYYQDFANVVIHNRSRIGSSILSLVLIHCADRGLLFMDIFGEQTRTTIDTISSSLSISPESRAYGLELLTKMVPLLQQESAKPYINPTSLKLIVAAIRSSLLKPIKKGDQRDTLLLLAALLSVHGRDILWNEKPTEDQLKFFMVSSTLSSSELRASLAPLSEKRDTVEYVPLAMYVSAYFIIIQNACLYLVEVESTNLAPHEILLIRDNFAAAFGETIAYLRDRWDSSCYYNSSHDYASIQGPARIDVRALPVDMTIIAATQSLCVWLQEDESLRSEACGLMDILLGLVAASDECKIKYPIWILPTIAALTEKKIGREEFVKHGGYNVVESYLTSRSNQFRSKNSNAEEENDFLDCLSALHTLLLIKPRQATLWMESHPELADHLKSLDQAI